MYTLAINYYSNFPNHWAGPTTGACPEAGDEILNERAQKLAEAVRAIKNDTTAPCLMAEFRRRACAGGTMVSPNSRKKQVQNEHLGCSCEHLFKIIFRVVIYRVQSGLS